MDALEIPVLTTIAAVRPVAPAGTHDDAADAGVESELKGAAKRPAPIMDAPARALTGHDLACCGINFPPKLGLRLCPCEVRLTSSLLAMCR
jgi:hypothetical protein